MTPNTWPELELEEWNSTRDTLHARIRAIGAAARALAEPLPHWWHIALIPGNLELSTRPLLGADGPFVATVDLAEHHVLVEGGGVVPMSLPGDRFAAAFVGALSAAGAAIDLDPGDFASPDVYEADAARRFGVALGRLVPILASATDAAGGSTGPVNFWPHHFDLAVSWFSGRHVPGVDPADDESAAEQVTLGFSTGDESIAGPYCYATAYPLPEGLVGAMLPSPARWNTAGFTGGVLGYSSALETGEPEGAIGAFFRTFLAEAATRML
jgi:hypothetical protein